MNFEQRKAEIFRRSEEKRQKRVRTRRRILLVCTSAVLCIVLGVAMLLPGMLPAKVHAADLMAGVPANAVSGKPADEAFISAQMELALKLFQASVAESKDQNVLVSPLSIQLALAMTANGANGQTRDEMEALLGSGLTLEDLNAYLYAYANSLPSGEKAKLALANSIWFRDDESRLTVEQGFLQTNADYYGAGAYKAPFDAQTLEDINTWTAQHTDGMINSILDEISEDAVMYLINALVFDAQWETVYNKEQVHDGTFTAITGDTRTVGMLHSEEYRYLDDGKAVGFVKNYAGGSYSFAALLPNEGVDIYDYVAGLTEESLLNTLGGAQSGLVIAAMPKFTCEYELHMNDILAEMGMPSAFHGATADFTKMASSSRGNLFIGDVLHKTFISVDELGTKAGAVTKVEMKDEGMAMPNLFVTLDRPFVYMIVDNATNLPLFIGVLTDLQG